MQRASAPSTFFLLVRVKPLPCFIICPYHAPHLLSSFSTSGPPWMHMVYIFKHARVLENMQRCFLCGCNIIVSCPSHSTVLRFASTCVQLFLLTPGESALESGHPPRLTCLFPWCHRPRLPLTPHNKPLDHWPCKRT